MTKKKNKGFVIIILIQSYLFFGIIYYYTRFYLFLDKASHMVIIVNKLLFKILYLFL